MILHKTLDDLSNYESLTVKVKNSIEKAIIRNEMRPGTRLKEIEIAASMGVSRAPVREAFRMLEADGLVVNQLRRGFAVAPLNLKEAEDIYEIRPWLEGQATRMAVKFRSDDFLARLDEIVREMGDCVGRDDVMRYTSLDAELHRTIYESSQNQVLIDILNLLWKKIIRYLYVTNSQRGEIARSAERHAKLVESLRCADPHEAGSTAEANMLEAKALLLQALRESGLG